MTNDSPAEAAVAFPDLIEGTFQGMARARGQWKPTLRFMEIGLVKAVSPGVATVSGLPGVRNGEMVRFGNGQLGSAFHITEDSVGCLVHGDTSTLAAGTVVERLGQVMEVPVGEGLLGRILDPTGKPLDERGPLEAQDRRPVEREAPPIMDRLPVTVPLQTGIKVIDALIPIGRGQRELIVGDRQTGKTTIALATMINQLKQGVICIYCAIGQQGASVARVIARLREAGALARSIVLVAEAENGPGLQFVAPYAATAMGEYFMEQGKDVLVVYDDLGSHARAYRELSLLMRRPPGREAYPGDIFYIHARLLERSTHLRPERGGGSLTALPIIATEAQNIAAYIPTNLISITDGQIYLSPSLFQKGVLPAVDVGKSVSRVGGKTQLPAYQAVSAELKLFYSQFEELEIFARFGTRLDEHTRQIIRHGRRIRQCLKQGPADLFDLFEQIVILLALTRGLLDPIAESELGAAETALRAAVPGLPAAIRETILQRRKLGDPEQNAILELARVALSGVRTDP